MSEGAGNRVTAIGKTGVEVPRMGLGVMPLSIENRPSEADAIRVIQAALGAGTRFLDTADVYCIDDEDLGHNERLIAKALKAWSGNRTGVTVATKGGLIRPKGQWLTRATPEHLKAACERSLKALGVESIFLYQLHSPDEKVPLEDSVGALKNLKEQGKIQHIGLSNVTADELRRAQAIVRIESVQNRFNPFFRKDQLNGVIEECRKQQVTYIAHSPVGGWRSHRDLAQREALSGIAKKHGTSPYNVMLAWVLQAGSHVLPIPGASRVESAVASPKALDLHLDAEDRKSLEGLGVKF